jgi:hypothetical protein
VSELVVVPAQRRFPDAVAVRFTADNASEITQWTSGLLSINKKTSDLELDYPVDGRPDPEEKKSYGETIVRSRAVEGDWIVFSGKFQTVTNEDFEVGWEVYPDLATTIDLDVLRKRAMPPPAPPAAPPDEPLGWWREEGGPWMPWDGA